MLHVYGISSENRHCENSIAVNSVDYLPCSSRCPDLTSLKMGSHLLICKFFMQASKMAKVMVCNELLDA